MEMPSVNHIPVWCHTCNAESTAILNTEMDYVCNICISTFVEELSQGIEEFTVGSSSSSLGPGQAPTGPSSGPQSDILQHILEVISGNGGETGQQAATGQQESNMIISDSGGRSMGIVIQQLEGGGGGGDDFSSLAGLLSGLRNPINTTATNGIPRNRGLFSLLNSLGIPGQGGLEEGFDNNQLEQLLHHILMNETSQPGAAPANDVLIGSLNREVVSSESDITRMGECSITQDKFEIGETAVALSCGHTFKEESIVQWLKMHSTCPTCRVVVE
jgi:Zn finger protein HypA/HybF involved in hydrogenase expression